MICLGTLPTCWSYNFRKRFEWLVLLESLSVSKHIIPTSLNNDYYLIKSKSAILILETDLRSNVYRTAEKPKRKTEGLLPQRKYLAEICSKWTINVGVEKLKKCGYKIYHAFQPCEYFTRSFSTFVLLPSTVLITCFTSCLAMQFKCMT